MEKRCVWMFGLAVSATSAANAQLADPATTFSWPVAPVENYHPDFGPFLDSDNFGKYHLGEDWNGYDYQDFGDPVYAVANGKVVSVQNISVPDRWGKVVVIEHVLLNQSQKVYSLYAHLNNLNVANGEVVTEGEQIGTIGNGNGYYGPQNNSGPHVHFEIRNDKEWKSDEQGYAKPPLNFKTVRRYKNPSLFIDDRAELQPVSLTAGSWKVVIPIVNSSMTTTYVIFGGRILTYDAAVAEKLVSGTIQYRWPDEWTWKNLTSVQVNWFAGVEYRVRANKTGVVLNLVLPGHNYQTERAVQDILWFAATNGSFLSCQPETIASAAITRPDPRFDFREMNCQYELSNGGLVTIPVYHATSVRYPLFRWLIYRDPDSDIWNSWSQLMPSQLDP